MCYWADMNKRFVLCGTKISIRSHEVQNGKKKKKTRCIYLKAVRLGRRPLTLIIMTIKNNNNMIELDKIYNEDCEVL